ncbi:cell division protein FtsZ [Thermaurantiacus sp.]
MPFDFQKSGFTEMKPRITVFGVGGAGCNAVANMIADGLKGVDFVVANTDAQTLAQSPAERRIQLGPRITQGLGAGARPELGAAAAEEVLGEIESVLEDAHMCFIAAGMGGGTGTGAAPVVARAARERGVLTVGVVTKPFAFEGARRMRVAEAGIVELQKHVDTLIVIPNQNLFLIASPQTGFRQAFQMADQVLNQGVRAITDLMLLPGLINLDFADVRTVMSEMGKAMMGTGEASGERRAIEAAEKAISNPLLDEVSLRGAKAVLINITGSDDLGLMEVEEAAQHIRDMVDPDANIILGSGFDASLEGRMRVSVVATGIEGNQGVIPGIAEAFARPAAPGMFARSINGLAARPGAGEIPQPTLSPAPAAASPQPPQGLQPAPQASKGEGAMPAPTATAAPLGPEPQEAPEPEVAAAITPAEAEVASGSQEIDEDEILDLPEPVAVAAGPRVVELPLPEPDVRGANPLLEEAVAGEEVRKETLFERLMTRSRRPKPEPIATLAPEPEAETDDGVSIPAFLKVQRN